jgi:hypothetical protein
MTTTTTTISTPPRRHCYGLGAECRLRWPAAAAAFVLLLGISGCGSADSGAGPASGDVSDENLAVDAAFVDRAEAVCTPYADYSAKHLLRLPGFSRFAPDQEELPKVAVFLDRNPAYHTLISKLESLGDPSTGSAAWTTAVADLGDGQRLVQEEIRSARAGDAETFVAVEQDRADSNTALHVDLIAAGLSPSSPCLAAQVDPLRTTTAMH